MIPQTQSVLKSYFQTGLVPTQAQFAELIDTMFFEYQNMQSNVDDAQAYLTLATESLITCAVNAQMRYTGSTWVTTGAGASGGLTGLPPSLTMRFTFSSPRPNTSYLTLASGTVSNKTVNYCDVLIGSAPSSGTVVSLVVF